MPKKDRPVVYRDLKHSPFKLQMEGVTFHFSSMLHLIKFKEEFDHYRQGMETRLFNRYGVDVKAKIYAAISWYIKVETRGFLIYNQKGEAVRCPKLELSGNPENVNE